MRQTVTIEIMPDELAVLQEAVELGQTTGPWTPGHDVLARIVEACRPERTKPEVAPRMAGETKATSEILSRKK